MSNQRYSLNNSAAGSSTMTMELPDYSTKVEGTARPPPSLQRPSSAKDGTYVSQSAFHQAAPDSLPSPNGVKAVPELIRWNSSRTTIFRVLAAFYSFIILGANDAAYGALIPYLEVYYKVNYTVISLVFLSPVIGYFVSAVTNNMIHVKFGQRGVAVLISLSHIIAYLAICLHPPYPVLVVVWLIAGYGNGLADSGWNAWVGDMANANEVLGFLHGLYGLGAALSPLVATTVITKAGWQWYQFYYILLGMAVFELFILTGAFWTADGATYRAIHATLQPENEESGTAVAQELHSGATTSARPAWYIRMNPFTNKSSNTALAVKSKVTVLTAVFLLFYVGTEVSIGGWIVTFMLRVRRGSAFASGITSTGFWLGVTVGRFVLGFVTGRLFPTEKHAVAVYLIICAALQLMFWLIPSFTVSAVMVGLLGFFLAPLFPAGIVVLTKLLPKRIHVAAVGFAAAVGASGATILPFAVGAIANSRGVQVLQPIVLALIAVTLFVWILIPKLPKQRMA